MKTLTLLICLLTVSVANSQDITPTSNSTITYDNGLYLQNNIAYTGKYTVSLQNGSATQEFTIKDGKLNGEVVKYYADGKKMEVGQYENNLKFGLWTRYNKNGQLAAEASYKNDKKDGTWMVYSDNGAKLFQMEYKDGEKTGTWSQWDESGALVKTTSYASM